MVKTYKFSSKDECLNFLNDLFKEGKNINIHDLISHAENNANHDKELYDFFMKEGKNLISSRDN